MTAAVRGAGQQVVRRGHSVLSRIVAVQMGVMINVRQVREKEAEVEKHGCSVMAWARQEERVGLWRSPPQHLSLFYSEVALQSRKAEGTVKKY